MNTFNNCYANIDFKMQNGKVVSYIDGQKTPDFVPIRAKLILFHFLKNRDVQNDTIIIDKELLQKILELDSFVTRELLFEIDGVILEKEELPDLFEYIPQILNHLKKLDLVLSKIDEKLIQEILYVTDLVVIDSFSS